MWSDSRRPVRWPPIEGNVCTAAGRCGLVPTDDYDTRVESPWEFKRHELDARNHADVVEMEDTLDLDSSALRVWVRLPSSAPTLK